jgi:hypothetical protein
MAEQVAPLGFGWKVKSNAYITGVKNTKKKRELNVYLNCLKTA